MASDSDKCAESERLAWMTHKELRDELAGCKEALQKAERSNCESLDALASTAAQLAALQVELTACREEFQRIEDAGADIAAYDVPGASPYIYVRRDEIRAFAAALSAESATAGNLSETGGTADERTPCGACMEEGVVENYRCHVCNASTFAAALAAGQPQEPGA